MVQEQNPIGLVGASFFWRICALISFGRLITTAVVLGGGVQFWFATGVAVPQKQTYQASSILALVGNFFVFLIAFRSSAFPERVLKFKCASVVDVFWTYFKFAMAICAFVGGLTGSGRISTELQGANWTCTADSPVTVVPSGCAQPPSFLANVNTSSGLAMLPRDNITMPGMAADPQPQPPNGTKCVTSYPLPTAGCTCLRTQLWPLLASEFTNQSTISALLQDDVGASLCPPGSGVYNVPVCTATKRHSDENGPNGYLYCVGYTHMLRTRCFVTSAITGSSCGKPPDGDDVDPAMLSSSRNGVAPPPAAAYLADTILSGLQFWAAQFLVASVTLRRHYSAFRAACGGGSGCCSWHWLLLPVLLPSTLVSAAGLLLLQFPLAILLWLSHRCFSTPRPPLNPCCLHKLVLGWSSPVSPAAAHQHDEGNTNVIAYDAARTQEDV